MTSGTVRFVINRAVAGHFVINRRVLFCILSLPPDTDPICNGAFDLPPLASQTMKILRGGKFIEHGIYVCARGLVPARKKFFNRVLAGR
jgi:hypothetical protein